MKSRSGGLFGTIGRRDQLVLLLIVSIGAAIRLFHLNTQSVWYDEAFSVAYAGRPVKEIFAHLVYDMNHPPLHHLLLHGWFQIAGFGAMQARLLSVIFGVASIPLLFLLARRFADAATSLVAAFLLAISQLAVYFSQEARPYSQVQCLSLLAALAFLSFIENPDFRRSMLFAAAGIALLYIHYYGAATLLALGVYWLIFRRQYSPLVFRRLCAIVLLQVVAFVPWILMLQAGGRFSRKNLTLTPGSPERTKSKRFAVPSAVNHFNNAKFETIDGPTTAYPMLLGLIIFTIPAAAGLWYTRHTGPQGVVLGWLLAVVPVGMAITLGVLGAIFNFRHYSFAVPGYYLAVAIGWSVCFRSISVRAAWLVIAAVFSAVALRANLVVTKPDYREGFRPLAQSYRAGDCVAGGPGMWYDEIHLAWDVYYRDRGTPQLVPFNSLATAYERCDRLWLVWDRTWWMDARKSAYRDAQPAIARLSDQYSVVERYDNRAIELQLFQRRPHVAGH